MSAIMASAFETNRMMRADFEWYRHSRFQRAHTELRGELLNAAGRAAHIDPASLFLGPWARVDRYASEELKAWFDQHGRLTVEEFETHWWNGRGNAVALHSAVVLADIARTCSSVGTGWDRQRVNHQTSDRYADHHAAEKIEQAVHSVTIGYRLTLTGAPPVDVASWHQDAELELYSVRVRAGADELSLTVPDWGSRTDEIGPFLREWITEHVHLDQSKLRKGCRRPDPYWVSAWRRAHPWL